MLYLTIFPYFPVCPSPNLLCLFLQPASADTEEEEPAVQQLLKNRPKTELAFFNVDLVVVDNDHVGLSTRSQDFLARPLQIFDDALGKLQRHPQLEGLIMKHLFPHTVAPVLQTVVHIPKSSLEAASPFSGASAPFNFDESKEDVGASSHATVSSALFLCSLFVFRFCPAHLFILLFFSTCFLISLSPYIMLDVPCLLWFSILE